MLRKTKNVIITLILVLIAGGLIVYILQSQYGFFRTAYEEVKSNANDLLGIDKPIETKPHVETPSYIGREDPDYSMFEEYNNDLHSVANNTDDYENSYLTKRLMNNLRELYGKSINNTDSTPVSHYVTGYDEPIELKVTNSYITYNDEDIEIPSEIWVGFEKAEEYHDDDGELISGYGYCVIETTITNTGNSDIGLIMTNPSTSLNFMDKNGELYWSKSVCDFISLQPGKSEKYAYYYYDFEKGESISISYVFTIPVAAFDYFECCFTVNGLGSSGYQPDTSSMVILESLTNKVKESN